MYVTKETEIYINRCRYMDDEIVLSLNLEEHRYSNIMVRKEYKS